jgi:hypothetical protein
VISFYSRSFIYFGPLRCGAAHTATDVERPVAVMQREEVDAVSVVSTVSAVSASPACQTIVQQTVTETETATVRSRRGGIAGA